MQNVESNGYSVGFHWLIDEIILGVGILNTEDGRLYGVFLGSLVLGVRVYG